MLQPIPITGQLSAGANTLSLGTAVFSNSNNVSFGINGQTITASVSGAGGAFSAGVSTGGNTGGNTGVSGTRLVLVGSQNITLNQATDANGLTVSFSGGAGAAGNTGFISANATASLGTVVFSNSNGVTFGVNGQTLTGSINSTSGAGTGFTTAAQPGAAIAGTLNSNGLNLGVPAFITTWTVPTVTNSSLTMQAGGSTLSSVSRIAFVDSNGVSFGASTSNNGSITITATVATNYLTSQSTQFLAMTIAGNTAGTSTFAASNNASLFFNGGNNITLSGNGSTVTISGPNTVAQSNQTEGYYFSGNTTISSTGTMDARSVSIKGAGAVTVGFDTAASQIVISGGTAAAGSLSFYASSNTTSTSSGSGAGSISIAGAGAISIAASNSGFIVSSPVTSSLSATGMVSISTNGSTISIGAPVCVGTVTAQTNVTWTVNSAGISLNAGGYAGTVSGATNCNVTVNTAGVSVSLPYISYLDLAYIWGNTVTSSVAGSISQMIPFVAPQPISVGSVRMFQVGTVAASSTEALVNGSTLSMSGQTSHNFVFYSRGVGASSQSLQYVTSTQVVDNCLLSIQNAAGANSSQLSYTYRFSLANTSFTKDYSSTAQSYNFHTSNVTDLTGTKMVDYPCGISLSVGQWFLLYGRSTTFATQNAVISVATRLNISYDSQFIASQNTQGAIGTLGGATNSSVPFGPVGLGSFSTGGAAGTTNSINISNISSGASNQMPLMQLVRIA